ncbi:hypothetical protein HMPREF2863_02985 [Micrococcus sp. HMSC067E09]|uniref:LpqB family beta-propeller domain-containing protein n=1 Tax=Micrococcus sp. HMSC067E09 TaxID=1739367 RepID=UPI0008A306E0|nr:LpqB family beta-propeller domain-containing protein [Micrococcus sp. HMSC067E09]OFR87582.1 hypothetical protein HMPREF2863_02985 [Micrococcus sp. HMSC067E09]
MTAETAAGRRRLALAVLAAASLALSACAQVPTSSPVGTSPPLAGAEQEQDVPLYVPAGPVRDAEAPEIIRGFLAAGVGAQDDYAIARQYLTGDASADWDPHRRTVVYSSQPTVTRVDEDGTYLVQVEIDSIVDQNGIRTAVPSGTTEAWELTVTDVDGQRRISAAEDGTMLSGSQFAAIYAPHELYFFDPTFTYAVPDVRWFINRGTTAAAMTRALLAGPAEPLGGAVVSAFPAGSGSQLSRPTVPVTDGVASVDLAASTVDGMDSDRRERLRQQIEMTLEGLSTVESVEVTVDLDPLAVEGEADHLEPVEVNPSKGTVQVGVDPTNRTLAFFQGLSVTPVGGLRNVSALDPVEPAMNRARTDFVFLTSDRTQMYRADTEGTLKQIVSGISLTRPTVDGLDWAWTVDSGSSSRIRAVPLGDQEDGTAREVSTPWLTSDETIRALQVGPTGARAALLVESEGTVSLRVAGVVRGEDGVPSSLTDPQTLETTVPMRDVFWIDDVTLAVTDYADDAEDKIEPQVISLDGTRRTLNPLAGLTGFSAGDSQSFYAETENGVYLLLGSSWRSQELTRPVRDLAFPG